MKKWEIYIKTKKKCSPRADMNFGESTSAPSEYTDWILFIITYVSKWDRICNEIYTKQLLTNNFVLLSNKCSICQAKLEVLGLIYS